MEVRSNSPCPVASPPLAPLTRAQRRPPVVQALTAWACKWTRCRCAVTCEAAASSTIGCAPAHAHRYNYHADIHWTKALTVRLETVLADLALARPRTVLGRGCQALDATDTSVSFTSLGTKIAPNAPATRPASQRHPSVGDGTAVRRWVGDAAEGYCGATEGAGDCSRGDSGSITLDELETGTWELAAYVCRNRLLSCARASYMTISLHFRDCSWYASCPSVASRREAAARGVSSTDFRSGPLERHVKWSGYAIERCDSSCPTYSHSSCMCSNGALRSDHAALQSCKTSSLCGAQVASVAEQQHPWERSRIPVPLLPSLLPLSSKAAILLFLVFDPAQVRPAFQHRQMDAYLREFKRASQALRSLQHVHTALPIYVVVGGERSASHERMLMELGAHILPVAPLPPPSWASAAYKNNFHKLLAMNMTQFSTVIVLDNDCVVLKNIDHLASSVATPAAACQPRRQFRLCSFNFGVHVLSPSQSTAGRLLATYTERKLKNNGGEQEVWANFHEHVYELPIGYNAHRGLEMSQAEWRLVHVVHAISGYSVVRLPPFLRDRIKAFEV